MFDHLLFVDLCNPTIQPTIQPNQLKNPIFDGVECGDPSLGLCQRSYCENNECVFIPDQANEQCLCGVCTDCEAAGNPYNCGGNCQFAPELGIGKPPSSLLLSVPCEYEELTVEVSNCPPITFYRDELGYFNISKQLEYINGDWVNPNCGNNNVGIQPKATFLGSNSGYTPYGNPPYNTTSTTSPQQCAIEFCGSDGQWEIHTSCSYDLYIGQAYGPQQDVIIAGYCLADNVSFAEFFIICLCQHLVMSLFSLSLSLTHTSFQTHFIE